MCYHDSTQFKVLMKILLVSSNWNICFVLKLIRNLKKKIKNCQVVHYSQPILGSLTSYDAKHVIIALTVELEVKQSSQWN